MQSCFKKAQMYLMEKTDKEQTEKAKKRKAFTKRTDSSKREKEGATKSCRANG